MKINWCLIAVFLLVFSCCKTYHARQDYYQITKDDLEDKIQGGLLGQIIGNLNGLPHEFKYFNEPGEVEEYIPSLPHGGRTDDDTDIEWVHIYYMQKFDTLYLSPDQIVEVWKSNMNKKIYSGGYYARQLMDIGLKPPQTGQQIFNPFAHFGLAGSFLCETYGIISPGMPQTAAKIGTYYTSIQAEGESLQVTQLVTSMISMSFFMDDIEEIIKTGITALDRNSELYQAVDSVTSWYNRYPDDYTLTREKIKNNYYTTSLPDKINDVPYNVSLTNTACVIAGMLYGQGDFAESLRIIFNLGWDADCNAATAGTILGVMKGHEWMMDQGWEVADRYYNATRDLMPVDETITSYGDRLADLAEKLILNNGGEKKEAKGNIIYRIPAEPVKNIVKLNGSLDNLDERKSSMRDVIVKKITDNTVGKREWAQAAYYAVSLELAEELKVAYPDGWARAVEALDHYPRLLYAMLYPKYPLAYRIRDLAVAAGIDMVEIKPSLSGNVEFTLEDDYPDADKIVVYGNFTSYSKFETTFGKENGKWVCRVDLKPGRYNYLFLIINKKGTQKWLSDPNNPDRGRHIDGYHYSFLDVE
jgi:hypothetical protein